MLSGKKPQLQNEELDERHAVNSHQNYYGGGNGGGGQADSGSMGSAAAMQALKMFNGGGQSGGGGKQGQSQFIGMAMGEASKLFGKCKTSVRTTDRG